MRIRYMRTRNIRAGKGDAAMDVGARWRDFFAEKYGVETSFGVQWGGPMGTVFFYVDFDEWDQVNEVGSTMWADERYVALEAEADDVFLQGGQETVVIIQ